jgi:predicted cupin superfamily sugar epimerase
MSRDVLAIMGTMQASGDYVSRAFELGTDVRLDAVMKTVLPAGSTLTVEVDAGDDDWEALPQAAASALADGTFERTYRVDPYSAVEGRLRLSLTGSPAARPAVSDLRAFTI